MNRTFSIETEVNNPGQVMACIGFMEVTNVIRNGSVSSRFEMLGGNDAMFHMTVTDNGENPFQEVLDFLMNSEVKALCPIELIPEDLNNLEHVEFVSGKEFTVNPNELIKNGEIKKTILPIRIGSVDQHIILSHWLDSGGRMNHQTFTGNQSGYELVIESVKKVRSDRKSRHKEFYYDPFKDAVLLSAKRFNFDSRAGWNDLKLGYSIGSTKLNINVKASPTVEILAAIGLEYARPITIEFDKRGYFVWLDEIPLSLCRVAFNRASHLLPESGYQGYSFEFIFESKGHRKGDRGGYRRTFPANRAKINV